MHYGQNNRRFPLYIDKKQLLESEMEKDLGVIFSTNLKWKSQVITATSRANQMLGRIKKSFARFDCKLMSSLYLTFVRPFLEFAITVWAPFLKGDIDMMERVQHRATKLVPTIRNHKYEDRLKILGLTTLFERRQRGDLIQVYKNIHEIEQFEKSINFATINYNLRGHCLKYFKEISRQPQRENFLFNRAANNWNSLPSQVVTAPTVNSFKAGLDCWMSNNQLQRLS